MTEYVVLLPGNESRWAGADAETRRRVYARHEEFARLLAERGHRVTGGAELEHSSRAKVVRGERGAVTVTDGPYAESHDWIAGFDVLEAEDLDEAIAIAAEHPMAAGGRLELRPFWVD